MATWADVAEKTVAIGIPFLGGASVSVVVAVFACLNSRNDGRRNRRLNVIETAFDELHFWEDRARKIWFVGSETPESRGLLIHRALEDSWRAPHPIYIAARLEIFGFEAAASAMRKVFDEFAQVFATNNFHEQPTEFQSAIAPADRILTRLHRQIENEGWWQQLGDLFSGRH